MKSYVTLVGAGPGKGLITVKGLRALQNADMVFYDDLIDADLLNETKEEAELVYVGKRYQAHSMNQDEISRLLIGAARSADGLRIVRLKGGDGFVFGRGSEEMPALQAAGVPCEIIPGVTSAVAVPEQLGIPVTHRKTARSFTVVTGHTAAGPAVQNMSAADTAPAGPDSARGSGIDYASLARLDGTLVFLMGLHSAREISERLIHFGKKPDTPCAILSRGFQPGEDRLDCRLCELPDCAEKAKSPAIILIGETAAMKLTSTVNRPLDGRHILVTGTEALTRKMADMLTEDGASVSRCVCLKTVPDEEQIDRVLRMLGGEPETSGAWLVFTSGNGVRTFMEGMRKRRADIRLLAGHPVAAIGSGTAAALRAYGIFADFIPSEYTGQALGRELGEVLKRGGHAAQAEEDLSVQPQDTAAHPQAQPDPSAMPQAQPEGRARMQPDPSAVPQVLLLRAEVSSRALTEELERAGISFADIPVYYTEETGAAVRTDADTVIFLSAAGVRAYARENSLPSEAEVICIGPVARKEFEKLPDAEEHSCIMPEMHTCEGILEMMAGDDTSDASGLRTCTERKAEESRRCGI